jgi:uncharacterized protein Yka (UPF0111/DUF47 family)
MIDEVAIMMNMLSINSIREPAKEIMNLITKGCAVLESATVDSRTSEIQGTAEASGRDQSCRRRRRCPLPESHEDLFSTEKDPLEVIRWQNIYQSLETCGCCENVADIMEWRNR